MPVTEDSKLANVNRNCRVDERPGEGALHRNRH